MIPDRLIPGQPYLLLDQDGQMRQALYQKALISQQGQLVYRFRIRVPDTIGYAQNLTADEVLNNVQTYMNYARRSL